MRQSTKTHANAPEAMNEIFEKNSDFGKWLESNYWFQDGHLLDYKFDGDRDVIYLKLGYQISGTNEAKTTRILRVFSKTLAQALAQNAL